MELKNIDPKILTEWAKLCHYGKCPMCSTKMDIVKKMPRDTETPFSLRIDGKFLWHMCETHGLFPETTVELLLKRFKPF